MEILVDPADQSAHCMNISVGKLNWFWQCPLGLPRFYLHRCFLIDFSTRFGLTRPRQNNYIEREVFEKRLSQKENFKNANVTATHTLLGENKRQHRYTVSVNSLSTRAYCKIHGRLSLDCCKNKCANDGILSPISIRFCQCSTSWGVLKKGSIRGDSSRGLTPSPFTLHFWQKRYLALSYTFLIDKW